MYTLLLVIVSILFSPIYIIYSDPISIWISNLLMSQWQGISTLKTAWFEPFSWYVHSLMILNLPFCYTKEEKLLVTLPAWSYYENIFIIWGNLCKWSMLHREKGLCQFFLSQAHCNLLFAYNKLLEALSWSRVPDLIWSISLLDLTWRPTLAFL